MIGKTVERVVDLGYDGQAIVFTDGTAAHFQGTGYETDGCSVEVLTAPDASHLEALAEESERQTAVSRERNIARRELKARIKRNVSPAAWQNWCKVHVSPMESLTESLEEQIRFDIRRQLYGGFRA
jgi:hypothetical protein